MYEALFFLFIFSLEKTWPSNKSVTGHAELFWVVTGLVIPFFFVADLVGLFNQLFTVLDLKNLIDLKAQTFLIQFGILFLLQDLVSFLIHYAFHKSDFLWKIHSVHHAANQINSTTSFRHSLFEFLIYTFVLSFIGFLFNTRAEVTSLVGLLGVFICIWQHSSIKFHLKFQDLAEKLIITPRLHRIHHELRTEISHRNIGFFFSIWDILFKTYQSESQLNPTYGIKIDNFPYSSRLLQYFYPITARDTHDKVERD